MRTSNLTIVFTDIKGFTERTGRQSHELNQRMLRLHDALLMPVFRAFDGRLVKTIGDAFLVVFEAPTKAVLCGVAIQDRLWEFNRRVEAADQIHVRVAVNVGEVREDKGDVFGEPVNIAARVEGLADAGEVLFTEAVFLSMNKAEVPSEDRGVHELKGIAHPIRVYRVPQGAYRLVANETGAPESLPPGAASPAAGEAPPYGGLGLSRAGKLPPTDLESLSKETEIVPQLLAAGSGLMTKAGDLQRAMAPHLVRASGSVATRARGAMEQGARLAGSLEVGRRWAEVEPRHKRIAVSGGLAALLLLLFLGLRGDAVERAVSSGDLKAARAEVHRMEAGPQRHYAEGLIEEAEGSLKSAARSFEKAAAAGDRRGYRKLVALTKSEKCSARSAAANALGTLGDSSAKGALEKLAEATHKDEGPDSGLGSIFGCSSRRAAKDALERLGK